MHNSIPTQAGSLRQTSGGRIYWRSELINMLRPFSCSPIHQPRSYCIPGRGSRQKLNLLDCFRLLLKSLLLADGDTCAFDCSADSKAQRDPDFKFIFLWATLQHSGAIYGQSFELQHQAHGADVSSFLQMLLQRRVKTKLRFPATNKYHS